MYYLFSRSNSRGFTLIEMLVVIGIFVIMTGVVLANLPAFREKTGLDLIAQEIATTIRQAQVYGIGTRTAGTTDFTSYGIYLDPSGSYGLDNKSFILYADINGSMDFNGESTDKIIERFVIRGAAEISDLKGCDSPDDCEDLAQPKLDIFFQRFYPEANFAGGYDYVKIVLQSTKDTSNQRMIEVWNTGQIVVSKI